MFTSDVKPVSKQELDRLYIDRATLQNYEQIGITSKRRRSNSSISDALLHEANRRRHGVNTNSFIDSPSIRNNHREQSDSDSIFPNMKQRATVPISQSSAQQVDSAERCKKSWSYPMLRSEALRQSTMGGQQDPLLSMFHPVEVSDFPSQSLLGRSDIYPSLNGIGDSNKLNVFQEPELLFPATQPSYELLKVTDHRQATQGECTLPHRAVNNFSGEVPRPNGQSEGFVNLYHNSPYCDSTVDADGRFQNVSATEMDQPPNEMLTSDFRSKAKVQANEYAAFKTSHIHAVMDNKTGAIAMANSSTTTLDNNMIDQHMGHWMSMIGTPPLIPPHQQFSNKKLLLHPLSPYNYYYRDERDNIVAHISNESDPLPPSVSNFTVTNVQALLHQHWFIDPLKKKRKHRKSHGKMNFQKLSKLIAQRWHELPFEGREFYRLVARYDDVYYHQQLDLIRLQPEEQTISTRT
jgi:hypothetical protein